MVRKERDERWEMKEICPQANGASKMQNSKSRRRAASWESEGREGAAKMRERKGEEKKRGKQCFNIRRVVL